MCMLPTGTKFNYTTHGWTLLSAVVESASRMDFLSYMKSHIFKPLGMVSTGPEHHQPISYNRARSGNNCTIGWEKVWYQVV